MPSIFGNSQTHKGSFRAEDLELEFGPAGGGGGGGLPGLIGAAVGAIAGALGGRGGGAAAGALVQQATFTATRQVNMIYEIGSNNVYYVGNRRQGQAQFQRIVGNSNTFKDLLTKYGDFCNPADLVLKAKGGCGGAAGGNGISYKMLQATLTQVGASVTAQDIVVTESLGFIFVDLEIAGA